MKQGTDPLVFPTHLFFALFLGKHPQENAFSNCSFVWNSVFILWAHIRGKKYASIPAFFGSSTGLSEKQLEKEKHRSQALFQEDQLQEKVNVEFKNQDIMSASLFVPVYPLENLPVSSGVWVCQHAVWTGLTELIFSFFKWVD